MKPSYHSFVEGESTTVMSVAAADEGTTARLEGLQQQLNMLEKQLHLRGEWLPPAYLEDASSSSILDLADLSNAINILGQLVSSTSPAKHHTPQQTLSIYNWSWDPAWHEFYTYIPSRKTYIYLSRWKLNEARDVWEHVSMAGVRSMPDVAAEMFGAWEDWAWDATMGQWFLDLVEGSGEKIQVFASPWRVQEDGEWVYVGMIGRATP
jgi:hypothetical protein